MIKTLAPWVPEVFLALFLVAVMPLLPRCSCRLPSAAEMKRDVACEKKISCSQGKTFEANGGMHCRNLSIEGEAGIVKSSINCFKLKKVLKSRRFKKVEGLKEKVKTRELSAV